MTFDFIFDTKFLLFQNGNFFGKNFYALCPLIFFLIEFDQFVLLSKYKWLISLFLRATNSPKPEYFYFVNFVVHLFGFRYARVRDRKNDLVVSQLSHPSSSLEKSRPSTYNRRG